MMRDITLGQYFPGDSPVHRLDPRFKLVLLTVYIVALMLCKHLVSYGVMFSFLTLACLSSRIPLRTMLKGMKPMVFIIIFTAVLNIFYSQGEPIFTWGIISITEQGLWNALFMAFRILMLIAATFLLTYTTSPTVLTDALSRLLSPLAKLRVPVHELAMMMTIALRFIPPLIEETDKIMSAQKARGADFETGSILQRARALIPLLVPLFVSVFRRADELAVAMECRCYHGGEGRTRLRRLQATMSDFTAAALCCLFFAAAIVLGRLGL